MPAKRTSARPACTAGSDCATGGSASSAELASAGEPVRARQAASSAADSASCVPRSGASSASAAACCPRRRRARASAIRSAPSFGTYGATNARIACSGWAPVVSATTRPWRKSFTAGMLRIAKREASAGSASVSTLTTLSFAPDSAASFSSTGASVRQGPHHAAQKSTSTGTSAEAASTSCANRSVVTAMTLDMFNRPCKTGTMRPPREDGAVSRHFKPSAPSSAHQNRPRSPS